MTPIKVYIARRLLSGWYKWQLKRQRQYLGPHPNKPVRVRLLNGKVMDVPLNDFIGQRVFRGRGFEYENVHMLVTLARRLGRLGTLLDIGANMGSHALYYADIFNLVHAFEPNPPTYRQLQGNAALNPDLSIHVHPFGLSKGNGSLDFVSQFGAEGNLGSSAFVPKDDKQDLGSKQKIVQLPVRCGDDVMGEWGIDRVDAIKIDVEGHEIDVLKGLQNTIKRDRPLIVFEYMTERMKPLGGDEEIMRIIGDYGLYLPTSSSRMRGHFRLLHAWLFGPRFELERIDRIPAGTHLAVFALHRSALGNFPAKIMLNGAG